MSKGEEVKYSIKLDFFGTQAAWHALLNTEAKGRTATRSHNRVVKALKADCMTRKGDAEDDSQANWEFKGGTCVMTEDYFKYLKEATNKKIDQGIPGSLAESYASLIDTIDASEDEVKKAAEKA